MRTAPRWELALYAAVRVLVVAFCRFWWKLEVVGEENLPADGAFVLAPVHRSNADTFVVSALTRRRLRYMGKHTLWKHKLPGKFLTAMGGFGVRRGSADREALRQCATVLEGGEPLVIFPEGTRQSGNQVGELQEGAAYLAARAGVPIVPVGIAGTEDAIRKGSKGLHRARVTVVAGTPIRPAPHEGRVPRSAIRSLSDEVHRDLQALLDQAQALDERRGLGQGG